MKVHNDNNMIELGINKDSNTRTEMLETDIACFLVHINVYLRKIKANYLPLIIWDKWRNKQIKLLFIFITFVVCIIARIIIKIAQERKNSYQNKKSDIASDIKLLYKTQLLLIWLCY